MRRRSIRTLVAAAAALGLALGPGAAWSATAAQPSTPDANVVLVNPASTGVQLAVTAHSDALGADHGSLTYRNGGVVLRDLQLHRLWVPGLGDHEEHDVALAADDHSCTDDEAGVIKIRGLSTQRGVGQVQVWIDVRPGHDGTEMMRLRVRPKTDCGGHDDGHVEPAAAPTDTEHGDHGAWSHNSGWIPLHQSVVTVRGDGS